MARNPKKVVDAFAAAGAKVVGVELREFTMSTIILMEKIDSPLLKPRKRDGGVDLSNIEVLRLVYILSKPPAECFRALSAGSAAFDEAVMEFGGSIPISETLELGRRITELFARAMSTAPGGSPGKKKAMSPTSPASPDRGTDSAGS